MSILQVILIYCTLLVPLIAWRYSYNTETTALASLGLLVLLVIDLFLYFCRRRANQKNASRLTGLSITFGLALGLLWAIEIGINNFIAPPLPARDIIDNIFWAVIAGSIFVWSLVLAYRTERLAVGIYAGTWTGFASGAVACGMALSIIVLGMRWIVRVSSERGRVGRARS